MKVLRLTPVFLDIETTGLDPIPTEKKVECEIIAIGVATLRDGLKISVFSQDEFDESEVIFRALHKILSDDSHCIVAYNIGFDFPFLTARALKHNFGSSIVTELRQLYRVDLMNIVTRYLLPNSRHIKLKDIASFLDIPHDAEISGADVPKLFEKGKFEAIKQHCQRDIETIYNLFFKLKDLCKHNIQRRCNLHCDIEFEGFEGDI